MLRLPEEAFSSTMWAGEGEDVRQPIILMQRRTCGQNVTWPL